ncbi:hypothetical protein GQR58_016298 [Nymphon striatum]|nr:hypothetical protein GQR58_016298 [Nymphon striatum]
MKAEDVEKNGSSVAGLERIETSGFSGSCMKRTFSDDEELYGIATVEEIPRYTVPLATKKDLVPEFAGENTIPTNVRDMEVQQEIRMLKNNHPKKTNTNSKVISANSVIGVQLSWLL